jgi:tRNA/rRNA methyltransferase
LAGTDSSLSDETQQNGPAPAIILVRPQLAENVGMCCRAMLNCGLTDLRLVSPVQGWPTDKGRAAASGADVVVDGATIFETTEAAIADLTLVYATTARPRDTSGRAQVPKQAARELRQASQNGQKTGIIFGPEAKGLNNDDVVLADSILAVPLNPAFKSLNLAQAVFCVSYEWFQAGVDSAAWLETATTKAKDVATKQALVHMFEHLETELIDCGFLNPPEKRPAMIQNIRTIFQRAELTDQEVRTMRGIISGLTRTHERKR